MSSAVPKVGENVKVILLNGESIEGLVEWIDGNGALVKGAQKTRWVPIESLLSPPPPPEAKKEKQPSED